MVKSGGRHVVNELKRNYSLISSNNQRNNVVPMGFNNSGNMGTVSYDRTIDTFP